MKRKIKIFYNAQHEIEYKITKFKVTKDILLSGLIFLFLGILIYSSFEYWIKFFVGLTIMIIIGLKEKNVIELDYLFNSLQKFKDKLHLKKDEKIKNE